MTTSGFHHADIKNKYFTRNVCSLIHVHTRVFVNLDSVSIKMSIVKSREITNSWDGTVHNIVRSFWYLIGIPAEMLPRHLSNIKAMWSLSYTISRIGNFARSYSYPPSTEAGDWTDTDRKADLHLNSGQGPACCLSCTDVFSPPSDECPTSVFPIRGVPTRQNRPMTKVQLVWNSSSDVYTDEISGQ